MTVELRKLKRMAEHNLDVLSHLGLADTPRAEHLRKAVRETDALCDKYENTDNARHEVYWHCTVVLMHYIYGFLL